jgi:hypothetical protein
MDERLFSEAQRIGRPSSMFPHGISRVNYSDPLLPTESYSDDDHPLDRMKGRNQAL